MASNDGNKHRRPVTKVGASAGGGGYDAVPVGDDTDDGRRPRRFGAMYGLGILFMLAVAAIAIAALVIALRDRDECCGGGEGECFGNILPVDQLSPGAAHRIFDGGNFYKNYNGTTGSDCFTFAPFGASKVCTQVAPPEDPYGATGVLVWLSDNADGIRVPGHQHDCSDETWFVANGSCTMWRDPTGVAETDFMGVSWGSKVVVEGPGIYYQARGTALAWACTPNTLVWTAFSPGSTGGIVKTFAVDIFGPSPTLPANRQTVMNVANFYCTVFRSDALDIIFP